MRTSLVFLALVVVMSGQAIAGPEGSGTFTSFGYGRLGYGGIFAGGIHPTPAMGFGYRAEWKTAAVDVSFFNMQINSNDYYSSNGAFAMSWLKLEALRFVRPTGSRSAYFGGGMSFGFTGVSRRSSNSNRFYSSDWGGSGLQGELTVGYEAPRDNPVHAFVQADIGLPLYTLTSESYAYTLSGGRLQPQTTTAHRYAPSIVLSMGVGWDRHHRRRH